MIEILLTVIPSVIWIIYRCWQLFQTPVEVLIDDLNIEIPYSANICIDSISNTSAVIHWDIKIREDENLFYILLINNKEAATLTSTSCKLNNLQQNKLYQIQITAINSLTNFRSQSNTVYIQTLCKSSADFEADIVNSDKFHPKLDDETNVDLIEEKLKPEGELSFDKIKTISNLNLLKGYLYYYQNELNSLFSELNDLQKNMSSDQKALMDEINQYKLQLHEETDNKIKKDNDVKDLENQKDNLTFKKLKLNKQLETLNTSKNIYDSNLNDLKVKIKKLNERKLHIISNKQLDITKINYEIKQIFNELQFIKNENFKIEEVVKTITTDKKRLVGLIDNLRPLLNFLNYPVISSNLLHEKSASSAISIKQLIPDIIQQFNNPTNNVANLPSSVPNPSGNHSPNSSNNSITFNQSLIDLFNKDGTLTKAGEEVLTIILELKPEWKLDFDKELNELIELENEWKICFKNEIRKYTSIYNSLDIAKMNNDVSHQPQKMTEYSASIEFGGLNNALPKPGGNNSIKFKSKNFIPNTDSTPAGGHIQSPSGYDAVNSFGSNFLNGNSASPSPIPSANSTIDDSVVNRSRSVSLNNGVVLNNYSSDSWHSFYGNVYTNSNNNVEEVLSTPNDTLSLLGTGPNPLDPNMLTPTQLNGSLLSNQMDNSMVGDPSLIGGQMAASQSRGFPYDDQIYNNISSPIEDPNNYLNYNTESNLMNYNSPPIMANSALGLNSSLLWNDGLLNDSNNNLSNLNTLSGNLSYNNNLLGSNNFLGVNGSNNLASLSNSDLSLNQPLGQSAFANPLATSTTTRFGQYGNLNNNLTPPAGQVDISSPASNAAVVGSPNTSASILLSNSSSQLGHIDFGNKLWNENNSSNNLGLGGHVRNVSSNSRDGIWRNGTSNPNSQSNNNGAANNFQPFSFNS